MKKNAVTLTELLITIVVLGILSSVGYVAYDQMIERSHKEEAIGTLVVSMFLPIFSIASFGSGMK